MISCSTSKFYSNMMNIWYVIRKLSFMLQNYVKMSTKNIIDNIKYDIFIHVMWVNMNIHTFSVFLLFFSWVGRLSTYLFKKKCGVHYIIIIIMKHIFLIKNKNRWCITAHTTIVLWNEMEMRNVFVDGKKIFFSFPLLKHL